MAVSALTLALALCAAEVPPEDAHMYQLQAPETVSYPNWVVTPLGRERIAQALEADAAKIAQQEAEAAKLRATVVELAAKPELTWKNGLFLVGLGLVVGGASVALASAPRK